MGWRRLVDGNWVTNEGGRITGPNYDKFENESDMIEQLGGFEALAKLPDPIRTALTEAWDEVPDAAVQRALAKND
jgi:hypothetical protein